MVSIGTGMETARRILALLELPGIGRITVRRIIAGLGGPQALAQATTAQITLLARAIGGKRTRIGDDDLAAALTTIDPVLARVADAGARVLTPGDAAWPAALDRLADDTPLLLYVRGDAAALARPGIAIVGTRQPTPFGAACAQRFGLRAAEARLAVVSGLALGCDTGGHTGCLDAQGITSAVLPGPIDRIIPWSNRQLADRILACGGCLIGEYPPDDGAPADEIPLHQFVARDRIQAGLARGVLVVETGPDDGTMHTVHAAQRLALPIACLMRDDPAWLAEPATRGNQQLVADGVATPLRTADDLRRWLTALAA